MNIAFLGLGAMGSRMARRLVEAGFDVNAYNRSSGPRDELAAAGASVFGTAREAVDGADVVLSIVTNDEASRAVWLDPETGAFAGMKPNAVAVESSTVTPAWIAELAEQARARGHRFLDAPVVGTRPQAEAGALHFLVGGPLDEIEGLREVLEPMAAGIHAVGPPGAGATMKLVVNALFAIQAATLGELLGMAQKAGMNPGAVMELLGELPVTSPAAKMLGGAMVAGKFDPLFPVELVEKDLGYAADTGAEHGQSMPVTAAAHRAFANARAAGFGGDNITGVARPYLEP